MPKEPITRYGVDELVRARKLVSRVKQNTLQSSRSQDERAIRFDVRRADSPAIDLSLELYARIPTAPPPGIPRTELPSASLRWKGARIRGIDYKVKHPVLENGLIVDYIRGWHEHYWSEDQKDSAIRIVTPPLKNQDLQALLAWCFAKWNVEGLETTGSIFNE